MQILDQVTQGCSVPPPIQAPGRYPGSVVPHMRLHDLGAFLNLLPVHAQGLPIGIEGDLEIKGMGSWTVIFQVLQPLCALGSSGSFVIWYPPGDPDSIGAGQSPLTNQSSRLLRTSAWKP